MGAKPASLTEAQIDHDSIPGLDDQYGPNFVTECRPCSTWSFSQSRAEWTSDEEGGEEKSEASKSQMPSELSCVSYNIWFAQFFIKERAVALAALLESLLPSIVCLVEVRPEPLKVLMDLPWVRDKYYLSTTTIPIGGNLIMVSRSLPRPVFEHHTWPTNMPRIFLTARFGGDAPNSLLMVGCVHLESMASQPTREGQLRVCSQVLRSAPRALLMGDFNISEKKEENAAIIRMLPSFVDVWPSLHKRQPGYSRDTTTNTMLAAKRPSRYRIDRIMCKGSASLVPRTISLLGDREFGKLKDEQGQLCSLFISDHFGLHASFELR